MANDCIFFHQARFYPLESVSKLSEFLNSFSVGDEDMHLGLLTDENVNNQVYLLSSDEVKASFRLNLPEGEMITALNLIATNGKVELRHLQGRSLTQEDLSTLDTLFNVWELCNSQSSNISIADLIDYITRSTANRFNKGRGKDFTKPTINQVMRDSHGYCMFEGCGEKLDIDSLTGESGNFSYLAHNVASSESGPRGIIYLSEQLSDTPSNVLLLCDKHHRLIDRVACANYPASRLTQMRNEFQINAEKLLEGLSYHPIPVFSVLWPVGGHVVSPPEMKDIAGCLSRLKARIKGTLNNLSGNERRYISKPERFSKEMDEIVVEEANDIINQSKDFGYRAALFAFGPMPALVGLGASIGNKSEITPMLRYRDGNNWMWPQTAKIEKPYEINGLKEPINSKDVTLLVALTNFPEAMKTTAENLGHPQISIVAKQMGNAAIPHPENGLELKADLHSILQSLHDKYKVERVHLLICASNAACVFVGQAFDLYQPEMVVYDFDGIGMIPAIVISQVKNKVHLSLP
ncbi:SAVED domain-containing protein [Alteromonas macleodii]|uniref:SAVED domain-containing protein n=1 Tax=Alteromonas macleodii TaxID=28108 RepID=UPI00365EF012